MTKKQNHDANEPSLFVEQRLYMAEDAVAAAEQAYQKAQDEAVREQGSYQPDEDVREALAKKIAAQAYLESVKQDIKNCR